MDLLPEQWSRLIELGGKMKAWSLDSSDGLHDMAMAFDDTLGDEDPEYYLRKDKVRVFDKEERHRLYRAASDANYPSRRDAAVAAIAEIKSAVLARMEQAAGMPMEQWPGIALE